MSDPYVTIPEIVYTNLEGDPTEVADRLRITEKRLLNIRSRRSARMRLSELDRLLCRMNLAGEIDVMTGEPI